MARKSGVCFCFHFVLNIVAEIATFFHISTATWGAISATLKRNARNRSALPMPNNTAIVDATTTINCIPHWHKNIAQKGNL